VFDLGFAINRALVYGVVSVVLLVSFGLAEWLAHHFISFEETEKSVVLDGAIALGLYLAFHQLKHKVEHFVERLFFHKWHQNEARLRRFVLQATHITSSQALIDAYLAALQRFTGNAGFAFYRRSAGSGYLLAASAGMTAPQRAGLDDALAVCLRAEVAPAVPSEAGSSLPGALALPMSFRGELHGFLLLGPKTNRAAYRPDEIEVLAYSAHQISLDMHALQTEQLQAEVSGLRQELGALNKTIEFAKQAGLVRQGPVEHALTTQ
jgi:hypothetical protein